ncbi:MAG: hypothetical protein LW709_04460 [Oxalobacteraceae bacterium]|jgi:hypothetical protein|nr:hypothetical protein [Oxalobacteraceae bacterium]
MTKKSSFKYFVLVGPSGKQAGRKDQHKIALQLVAIELTKNGEGGGIIDGLLPRSAREKRVLKGLVSRGYKVKKVKKRITFRKDVRDAVLNDVLVAQLAVRYELVRGYSRRAMSAVNQDFSNWICGQLTDPKPNEIRGIVGAVHPELLNMTRPDWWKKQLNQRVKRKSELSI